MFARRMKVVLLLSLFDALPAKKGWLGNLSAAN